MVIDRCTKFMRDFAKVVLAASVATVCAQAQNDVEAGTNFQGQIRYENNAPAGFIQVELWTDGESTWHTFAMTDRAGRFHAGAPCMIIQYKIETPGYRSVSGQVDMSITPCRARESITLKALPGTNPGAGPAAGVIDARVAAIPPDAKQEFDAGQRAINDNDFIGAIPHLQKAVTLTKIRGGISASSGSSAADESRSTGRILSSKSHRNRRPDAAGPIPVGRTLCQDSPCGSG